MTNDEKCPVCGRNLGHFNHEGMLKHIRTCKKRRLGELHSNGKRGRPRVHHHIRDDPDIMNDFL